MRNKKNYLLVGISLLTVFIISLFLIHPNFAPDFIISTVTPDINLKDENFNGVDLKRNINELHVDDTQKDVNNPQIHYLANGIRAITNKNGSIKKIAIDTNTNKSVKTSRGISLGDSLEKVKRNYGEDYFIRREQGIEILVYVDNNQFLEFWHWSNEVQEIRFVNTRID